MIFKYIVSIVLLFTLVVTNGRAQDRFNLRTSFGNSEAVIFTGIHPTDSCYYLTGIMVNPEPNFLNNNFFAKLDLKGELLQLTITKDSFRTFESWKMPLLAKDSLFIVGGYSFNYSGVGASHQAMLLTYNDKGELLKKDFYNSLYSPDLPYIVPQHIIAKENGSLVMLSEVGNHGDSLYEKNAEIIKTDSSGNVMWRTAIGDISREWTHSLAQLSEGGYMIGMTKNVGDFHDFDLRSYLVKINEEGQILWEWLSPDGWGIITGAYGMITESDGSIILAGGKDNRSPNAPIPELNEFILKIDGASGQKKWEYKFKEQIAYPDHYTSDLVKTEDNTGYVGCKWGELVIDYENNISNILGTIWKLSNDGDSLWKRTYRVVDSDFSEHHFYDIEATSDGGYIICGSSTDKQANAELPNMRGWLLKVDEYGCLVDGCEETVSTDTNNSEISISIKLFPNPVSIKNDLIIGFKKKENNRKGVFKVFDIQGRELRKFFNNRNEVFLIVPIRNLTTGAYFLTYEEESRILYTTKFVVK